MGSDRTFVIALHAGLIAVLAAVGGLGIKSAFVSYGFAPVVFVAAVAGVLVPVLAHRNDIAFPFSSAISLVAMVLVGTVLSYLAPWRVVDFASDLVESWRRILTIAAPVDPQSSLIAVPIVLTWLGASVGAELALRTKRVALPLVGPLATAIGAILFGLDDAGLSVWIGIGFFLLATIFVVVRSREHWLWSTEKGATNRGRRLAVAGAVVAAAVLVSPTIAERVFNLDAADRFTLRQQIDPPFDLTRLSSPLAELKGSLPTADMTENEDRGDLAFRISGDPISRIRLAVLDDYDGTIWLINRNSNGADFIRAGTQFPPPDEINQGEPVQHTVEVVGLAESWLPTGGTAVGLDITSDVQIGGVAPVELIRLDRVTGNLIVRPRLRTVEGLTYDVSSVPTVESADVNDDPVSLQVLTSARNTSVPDVPPSIAALARDSMADADNPFDRVTALQAELADQVYDAESTPGHLLIQLASIAERSPMVAFDEQYAALMATTLRSVGIPARVAVGFVPPEESLAGLAGGATLDVFETDIEAWVEVPFDGLGWVAFDAGPDDSQTDEIEDGTSEAQAESVSANPPPPVSSTTSTTLPPVEEEEEEPEEEEQQGSSFPVLLAVSALAVGVPLLILGLFALIVVLLKQRRRSARRRAESTSEQVHGAYLEYVDRSLDAGLSVEAGTTPRAAIEQLSEEKFDPLSRSGALITLVEDAAFAPVGPEPSDVDDAWEHSGELVNRIGADLSSTDRLRASLSLRSLRSRDVQ